ncbi:DUF6988 family protein [Lysobacter terrae]
MDALERLLERSAALTDTVAVLFQDVEFDGSPRGQATLGMCDIAFEHAESLKLLISAGLHTSGIAMLRLQYEALVRGAWLWHAAGDNQVARLQAPLTVENQQAAKNLPSVKEMLADLGRKGPPGAERLLTRFRDRLWDGLNSFVHGGIHPLRRNGDGYPTGLLSDLVKNSNAVSLLTVLVLAELSTDAGIAMQVVTLNRDFVDCVPALEPFPNG